MTTSFRARTLACALLTTTATCGLTAAPAAAQTTAPVDMPAAPVHSMVDRNGVDLASGQVQMSQTDVSIGPDDHRGLRYSRVGGGANWRDNVLAVIDGTAANPTISFGGSSEQFTLTDGSYVSVQGRGSTLTRDASGDFTYTAADGTVILFTDLEGSYESLDPNIGWVSRITYPDGSAVSYHYRTEEYCTDPTEPTCPGTRVATRLQSVTNNSGYQLKFEYEGNVLTGPVDRRAWQNLVSVTGINNGSEYCQPNADQCALSGAWPKARYARTASGSDTLLNVTNPADEVTRYRTSPGGLLTGVKRPSSSTDNLTFGYDGNNRVASVTTASGTWSYIYADDASTRTTTVTNPLSQAYSVVSEIATGLIRSVTDALGRTTSYSYDTKQRPLRVTAPEGNYVETGYDARGNATQNRAVAKPGSGLADIVTSAAFTTSCTNPKTCNKPTSTTDPRGNTTDYSYDATHGGLLTVTLPAPTTGAVRPQTRIGYTAVQAFYKNSTGSIVASGTSIFLPTSSSACQTQSSCTGTADEVKTTVSYGPQSAGTANNLLPTIVSSGAGNGSLTATSSFTHDPIANLVTVDGPLDGPQDTSRTRYDAMRRPVGMVSPDPDGAGALKHRAVRTTYNVDGQAAKIESGNVNSQSDGDWGAMTALEAIEIGYDTDARPVTQKLTAGGTVYSVTQTTYNSADRPKCTAQRMNPGAFGSLPASACSLGAEGSFGPDRISRTFYDAAGQVTEVLAGVGTSSEAAEVRSTYTLNGQAETVTDGENNKTAFEYDGHGRLSRTYFPSRTKGAGTANANDYEEQSYDQASNVTSFRNRGGDRDSLYYDALNRLEYGARTSYKYDLLGRMTESHGSQHDYFSYDALSRKLREDSDYGGAVLSSYDLAGRRTRITYPDGFFVDQDYLVTGEMTRIRENGATSGAGVLASFGYNDLGRRTSLTRGNGTSTTYSYDTASRLSQLSHDLAGTAHDVTSTFSYNPASQIVSTTRSNDLYAFTAHESGTVTEVSNGLNQLVQRGGIPISYDPKGNVTYDPATGYYLVYNHLNQLNSVSTSEWSRSMAYDGLGRLRESAATRFRHDGDRHIAEYNDYGPQLRTVHGPLENEPLLTWDRDNGKRFFYADERGSVVAAANSNGAVDKIYAYDEFGVISAPGHNRFEYTGHMYESMTQLIYARNRFYHPKLGRFMQSDPSGYGDGMNMYGYVKGDPVNKTDPTGTSCVFSGPPTAAQQAGCVASEAERWKDYSPGPSSLSMEMAAWTTAQEDAFRASVNLTGGIPLMREIAAERYLNKIENGARQAASNACPGRFDCGDEMSFEMAQQLGALLGNRTFRSSVRLVVAESIRTGNEAGFTGRGSSDFQLIGGFISGAKDYIRQEVLAQRARMGADVFFHTHPNVDRLHVPNLSPGDTNVAIKYGMFVGAFAFSNSKSYWYDGRRFR